MKFRDPLSRYHEFLLPPRVDEWIPPGHMVRISDDSVELLDWSAMKSSYHSSAVGAPACLSNSY